MCTCTYITYIHVHSCCSRRSRMHMPCTCLLIRIYAHIDLCIHTRSARSREVRSVRNAEGMLHACVCGVHAGIIHACTMQAPTSRSRAWAVCTRRTRPAWWPCARTRRAQIPRSSGGCRRGCCCCCCHPVYARTLLCTYSICYGRCRRCSCCPSGRRAIRSLTCCLASSLAG